MLVSSNAYQYDDSIPADTSTPEYDTRSIYPRLMHENRSTNDLQMDDPGIDYTQEGMFFRGFILSLPVSALFWVIIILGIKTLFF